jgi:hypothetical protein
MALLFTLPRVSTLDLVGAVAGGAGLSFYTTGTSTPLPVYSDSALTIPISQPVRASDAGLFPAIYLNDALGNHKIVCTDADGVELWTVDPYLIGTGFARTAAESASGAVPIDYNHRPYVPNRYAVNTTPGTTDMAAAIQTANNAAAVAGAAVKFNDGEVYGVNITARGDSLAQTADWVCDGRATIQRIDFTSTTAYFTMQQTGQTGLRLSGLIFDGQLTKAGSSTPNQDLAEPGSYTDNISETLWCKPYGVRLYNATDARIENCAFKNTLRAGLWIDGDGLASAFSSNVKVSNCDVIRTRSGSAGDGFYVGGATDVKFVNCHVYDYQRIAFVTEYSRGDSSTNCRDIEFVNCTADFGHDAALPESNAGFWVESGDNVTLTNCTAKNTGIGYVANADANSDTGTDRPFVAAIGFVNCRSLRTQVAMRLGFGGLRSIHCTVSDFFGEANRLAPAYATANTGLRAGILIQCNEVTSGVNFRIDLRNIEIHAINQSTDVASNAFGAIRVAQGTVTTPQQLILNVDGLQTQWSLTDGSDDVDAKENFQTVSNSYFGDVVFSGASDTTPNGRYKGHAFLSKLTNHTFGYCMFASEIGSSDSNVSIRDSRVSMRVGIGNGGTLRLSDCPLVDWRGNIGFNQIFANNCTFADSDASSTDRTYVNCPSIKLSNCYITRQLCQDLAGGDTTHRKYRFQASGCEWFIRFDTEPGLLFSLGDGLFAHAQLSGCAFRNNGAGSISATDAMIRVQTGTGTMHFSGAGNVFDAAVVSGGGHVIETNSTPTYNDAPQTASGALLSVWGVNATFDPV